LFNKQLTCRKYKLRKFEQRFVTNSKLNMRTYNHLTLSQLETGGGKNQTRKSGDWGIIWSYLKRKLQSSDFKVYRRVRPLSGQAYDRFYKVQCIPTCEIICLYKHKLQISLQSTIYPTCEIICLYKHKLHNSPNLLTCIRYICEYK